MSKRLVYLAAWLVLLVGAACAGSGGQAAAPFDQQFIDMMVPHHQGAVEMARIAQLRAQRAEIKRMADDVIRAQDAEIAQMKQWRKSWFGSDHTPLMDRMPMVEGMATQHGGHGGTMDIAADVEQLRAAGEPFDRAFIDAMIPHHESAIGAARAARSRAQRDEVKNVASEIVAAQEREIAQMKEWRRAWFGA